MVLGKLPVPGRPTIWITVGQGPIALAVGAGGGCLDVFTLVYPFFPLSPSLWETARYRLKYCLKGPLNPKTTNQIQSELFRLVCEKFGVDQTRTAPYRPNSDGLVERFNRTLKQMLKIFSAENPKDWDDHLSYLLMAYRASPHKSTGCTPNLLFLQREVACPLDLMVGPPPNTLEDICPVQYIEWIKSAMHLTHEFVYEQLGVAATRQKTYHDHALKPRTYEIGDWVWRFNPPTVNQKLGLGWSGPYLVVNKISTLTYSIQKTDVSPIINVHVDHLKP